MSVQADEFRLVRLIIVECRKIIIYIYWRTRLCTSATLHFSGELHALPDVIDKQLIRIHETYNLQNGALLVLA